LALRLTWLGQAGFMVEYASTRILIDPFLSDHPARLYPPPPDEEIRSRIDWLLVTHEHLDHLDLEFTASLISRCPDLRVMLPTSLATLVANVVPTEQVTTIAPGDSVELAPSMRVDVMPAFHGIEVADGYSDGSAFGGPRFVGYVVRTPAGSLYHSGDTIVNDELVGALRGAKVDIALLPINGRDYFREAEGLVGNMNAGEAVRLAIEIGAHTLVPMHWDLFRGNTVNPGSAVDEAAKLDAPLHVLTLAKLASYEFPDRG